MLRKLVLTAMAVVLMLTLLPNQSFSWYTDSAQIGPNTVSSSDTFSNPVLYLTIVGNGTVTVNGTGFSVDSAISLPEGQEAVLDISPDVGWAFTGWGGALSGVDSPQGLMMDGDKSVTAFFQED